MIREVFPQRSDVPAETDNAVRLKVDLLAEIYVEVGADRFFRAVKDAISRSHSRYQCTVARVRECAGLSSKLRSDEDDAFHEAVSIARKFAVVDCFGKWNLQTKIILQDGVADEIPVPKVSEGMRRAVAAVGGWGGMVEPNEFVYRNFCEAYRRCD